MSGTKGRGADLVDMSACWYHSGENGRRNDVVKNVDVGGRSHAFNASSATYCAALGKLLHLLGFPFLHL